MGMPTQQIKDLAALDAFAQAFIAHHLQGGVFGLEGELGAGKTAFVRAVIHALSKRSHKAPPRVISPTYVLHQFYETVPTVDHFDLYRLENPTESTLLEVGYFEALDRGARGGFVFVEWPERLPQSASMVNVLVFQIAGEGRVVSGPAGAW